MGVENNYYYYILFLCFSSELTLLLLFSPLLRMVFSSFSMWAKSSEKFTITYYKAQNFCHWHKETNIGPYQLPKCCMHLMLFCTVDQKEYGQKLQKIISKNNLFWFCCTTVWYICNRKHKYRLRPKWLIIYFFNGRFPSRHEQSFLFPF